MTTAILVPWSLVLLAAGPDGGPLSLADLPAYRAAIDARPTAAEPATFRDLWSRPERFRGRSVTIEGREVRRFRQPAVGEFPALSEVWIVSPASDPTCLVFPSNPENVGKTERNVRFTGTFLRLIRYRAGDGDRLAPLIVGGMSPEPIGTEERVEIGSRSAPTSIELLLGVSAAGLVAMVLGLQHLRKPPARPVDRGPSPIFSDREDHDGGD